MDGVVPVLAALSVFKSEVCYDRLGCFTTKAPWSGTAQRPLGHLPWAPEKINTRFLLYTRDNVNTYQEVSAINPATISHSNFNEDRKSHFVIHGFTDSGEKSWLTDICQATLQVEDVNCFSIDWSGGLTLYTQAANNIQVVGAEVAYFITTLQEEFNHSLSNIHIIGHSLGAHAAGEAGKRRPGIGRITGWRYKLSVRTAGSSTVMGDFAVSVQGSNGAIPEYTMHRGLIRPDTTYAVFFDSEAELGPISVATFVWHSRLPFLFHRTLGASTVTVQFGEDGAVSSFCDSSTVQDGTHQILRPCPAPAPLLKMRMSYIGFLKTCLKPYKDTIKLKFCKERSHLVTLEFLSSAFLIQASDEWSITIRNSPQQWSILGAVLSSARSVLGAAGNTRSVKSNPGNSVPADDIIRRIQDYSPSMYTALRMMRITLLIIHMMTGLVAGGDVCYDHLGCFSDSSPWSGTLQRPHPALPWSPEKINTKFLLFTRELVSKYQIISGNNITSITSSTFRTSRASCLIVHGMADRAENNWVSDMCQAILAAEDVNCVGVDWRSGSGSVALYVQAANNARLVGAEIAYMLRRWQQELEYPPAKVHIIGHSLGAHAAGEAGWRLPGIRRITGLDPARPWFENTPEDVRLDPSDADFVDVIHTDTNKFTGVGIIKPIGHFDFYPNGGRHMTGCPSKLAILTNKG
ncbi:LOW QUALITY PROTEIN: uncharacterized protein ACNLHF_005632, partial [Anomaloglossus baeobatrachus]